MHHVRKEKWMGCAVASAAMLSDTNYEEVAAHWPDLDEAIVRSRPREFRLLLESLTDIDWHLAECWSPRRPVRDFSFPEWPVAVFIQDSAQRPRFGLWIVVRRGIVHDPSARAAYVVNRYPLRDWFVTWLAQPAQPDELSDYLTRNHRRKVDAALQSLTLASQTAAT
jgi:hypothetical protein